MSARVNVATSKTVQLGGKAVQQNVCTEADVQDPTKLASILNDLRDRVRDLEKRHAPTFIDFQDVTVAGSGSVRLPHRLGGRVHWHVIDWKPTVTGNVPILERDAVNTTTETLVLLTSAAGVATIRVELA